MQATPQQLAQVLMGKPVQEHISPFTPMKPVQPMFSLPGGMDMWKNMGRSQLFNNQQPAVPTQAPLMGAW